MALVTCKQLEQGLAKKQDVLLDCKGNALAAGTKVATCADLQGLGGGGTYVGNHNANVRLASAFDDEIGFIHDETTKGN